MNGKLRGILGPRPVRRTIVVAVPLIVVLLLGNTVLVSRREAPAASDSTVSVDDGELYVAQDGPADAPALVLVHGLVGSGRWWDAVVPALAENYRVIRVDLLGHGWSAKPYDADYRMTAQGRRVGEVLDKLDIANATLVGHSTGGSVVTALAEQRADLVNSLILIDTGPSLDAYSSQGVTGELLFQPVLGQLLWRLRTDSMLRGRWTTPSLGISMSRKASWTMCAA